MSIEQLTDKWTLRWVDAKNTWQKKEFTYFEDLSLFVKGELL